MSLSIDIIEKKFGEKLIFKDFHYDFPDKGIFLLKGDSGRGKTTLLRLIAGLDKKFKGKISGGGAKNVSFVFQEYRLFPTLSALDNVIWAVSDKKDESTVTAAKNLLFDLGFSALDINLLPSELSGGMKQRVSFARALLKNAPVLLLDEPTKELDRDIKSKMCEKIKLEAKERLVILVSHDSSDITLLAPTVINI